MSSSIRPLRILLVTHYYPPEIGAPQNRLHQLARHLSDGGHQVTVLTGFPNYPTGVIGSAYRGRRIMRDRLDGVNILRTWIFPTENSGFIRRLMNHLSFAVSATMASPLTGSADVVVVESPPLFAGAAGPIIGRLKRAKLVLNVADLWPEEPVAMGLLNDHRAIVMAGFLQEALLAASDHVVAVTPAIADYLRLRKGLPSGKVSVHSNSIDTTAYGPGIPPADMSEWFPNDDFAVMYTGTLSISHALHTVIEAARILEAESDVRFVLVGDGPDRARIAGRVHALNLPNVTLAPARPRSSMPGIMRRANVLLNSGMDHDMAATDFPAKTVEYLASERPIISCGQARAVIESSGGGIWLDAERPAALADAVMRLYRDPEECRRLARNGREYACRFFDRADVLREYEATLRRVAG